MSERQRILFFSILIMAAISVVVATIVMPILYHTALQGQRARLRQIVQSHARLLAAVAASSLDPDAALHIIRRTHENYEGFGTTGEFLLARREGDHITFLLHPRHASLTRPKPILFSAQQAKPMWRALSGQSGSMIGLDYRRERVLAAYEPVAKLHWGIVAKIDLSEIRAPFMIADLLAGGGAVVVILLGAILFIRISDPLMRRLEESEATNHAILDTAPDGIITTDAQGTIVSFNPAAERLFGYTADEAVGQSVRMLIPSPPREEHHGVHEVVGRRRDGATFLLDITVSQLQLAGRQLYTGIVRDMTERKQAEDVLKQDHDKLESRVAERTAALQRVNELLQAEITEREQAETALRSSRQQFRNLATHLQDLQEEERRHIAREIHDELAQTLTGLNMDLAWLTKRLTTAPETVQDRLQVMVVQIETLVTAVRQIATTLRPGVLDDLGLFAAIEWQLQEVQKRTNLAYELTLPSEEIPLEPARATAVFRIFQESITNVLRHADASFVMVQVVQKPASLLLAVRDNGKGITPDQLAHGASLGLLGMRERAQLWGGDVNIEGTPNVGTTVTVRMPYVPLESRGVR